MNFEQIQDIIVKSLVHNPTNFVLTLYTEKKKGIFSPLVDTYSPYLALNDQRLICLLDSSCEVVSTSEKIRDNLYRITSGVSSPKILQVININSLDVASSDEPYTDLEKLKEYQQPMNKCLFSNIIDPTIYISSDEYTNNLLISSTLGVIYKNIPEKAGMRGIVNLVGSTIYTENGKRRGINLYENYEPFEDYLLDEHNFYLFENKNIAGFSQKENRKRVLSFGFIIDLFSQLLVNLQMLQSNYNFNHGNLTKKSIVIQKAPIDIEYSTIRHKSNITFQIKDFRYSSIGLKRPLGAARLFNSNEYSRAHFHLFPFKPVIDQSLDESYYQIDDFFDIISISKIRHLGIQFYSSFDTITLILSLLTIPEIYYSVFSNNILKNIVWDILWHPQDESIMFERISKIVGSPTEFSDIVGLLRGRWIRCNLTDLLVTSLSRKYMAI